MKKTLKRFLSATLSVSLLAGITVTTPISVKADSNADVSVYDKVLDRFEQDFQKNVSFDDEGKAVITGHEWYDGIDIPSINRERSKSQFVPYQNAETALDSEKSVLDDKGREQSDFYQLLSGKEWDFALVKTPAEAEEKDATYLAMDKNVKKTEPLKAAEIKTKLDSIEENTEETKDNNESEKESSENDSKDLQIEEKEESTNESNEIKLAKAILDNTISGSSSQIDEDKITDKENKSEETSEKVSEESSKEETVEETEESLKEEVTPKVKDADTSGSSALFDASDFQKEYVPRSWQAYRNADGTFKYDEPMYRNQVYPWETNFEATNYDNPVAPTVYNPVGYYRTTFNTPQNWDGREIFISFQGVEAGYYVYVNGNAVGYSTDSFTAHDFNLTPYLNPAGQENTMAVKVYRWSTGSYLENQDFLRLSGIIRDVYLYSKDEVEIRDMFIKTKFDDRTSINSDVNVTIETDIRGLHNVTDGDYTLSAKLVDKNDSVVANAADETITIEASKDKTLKDKLLDKGKSVTQTMKVTNPDKWFPDTPNLYRLVLELKNKDGKVLEAAVQRVGFREVYKVDIDEAGREQIQITGKKMMLRGVNRHDSDHEVGQSLLPEDFLTDLTLMKAYNLNSIRTSHYPNDQMLYDLADELGLYICAEGNVESHAGGSKGGNSIPGGNKDKRQPKWVAQVLDRNANLLERYKNRSSIVMWSFGNEATYTEAPLDEQYAFWVTSMYMLKRDPDRIRKYERESDGYYGHRYTKAKGADPWTTDVRKYNIVDIHSTQYPLPSNVEAYAKGSQQMPYVCSEYDHSMGTSYGNAKEHWDVFRKYDNVQGGFIWDWIDQTVETTKDGHTFWGYGGDWIDAKANDNAFCGNGLIYADRTPSPKMAEVKKVHQQVNFYKEGTEAVNQPLSIKVVNEYENTPLSAFDITWKLTEDSTTELGSGKLDLSTSPINGINFVDKNTETVNIQIPNFTPKQGKDYLLDISVVDKSSKPWAKDGREIAFEQFQLNFENAENAPEMDVTKMNEFTSVDEKAGQITLTGKTEDNKTFEIIVDTTNGLIKSYKVDNKEIITSGPEQSYWRAQTYNDSTVNFAPELKNAGKPENMTNIETLVSKSTDNKKISVNMTSNLKVDASSEVIYDIYSNGEIVVTSKFMPNSNFAPNGLPKVGMRMTVAEDFKNLTYYGRGPEENYADRKTGSRIGIYESTVDKQFESKVMRPQSNANRTDTRWTALTDNSGNGILVSAKNTIETSALHYTEEELNNGNYNSPTNKHPYEIPQRKDITWNIDLMQHGVSDTAFMGHKPLDGYRIDTSKSHAYSYKISPISSSTNKMDVSNISFNAGKSVSAVNNVYLDGKELSGFNPLKTEYSISVDRNASIPVITADTRFEYTVKTEDGKTTLTTHDIDGQTVIYTFKFVRSSDKKAAIKRAFADNEAPYDGDATADKAIDGKPNTFWHSDWQNSHTIDQLWIAFELEQPTFISGVNYLSRQSAQNGRYKDVEVYVSNDGTNWTGPVGKTETSWENDASWKSVGASVSETVKYVKLQPTATYGDTDNAFGSAAEVQITEAESMDNATVKFEASYPQTGSPVTPDPTVVLDGVTLINGTDYIVTYENNVNVGTATATVKPAGIFAGKEFTSNFEITASTAYKVTVNGGTADKTEAYADGIVTITATVPEGKGFVKWASDDVDFANIKDITTTFVMKNKDVTINAVFADEHNIKVIDGTADKTKAMAGEIITVTTTVPEGKVFAGWSSNDADISNADKETATFIMPEKAVTITANFDNIGEEKYPITINGGTADKIRAGKDEVVTITAKVPEGKKFVNWTSNDIPVPEDTNPTTSFVMPGKSVVINANFTDLEEGENTITVIGGSSDKIAAVKDETITITAKVPEGKKFVNWTSSDVTFADANKETTTFVMPEKAVTITANFEDLPKGEYSVTVTGGKADKANAAAGETITITANVETGKKFVNWTSSDVTFANANSQTTTFIMPEKAVAITANFENLNPNENTITVTGGTANKTAAVKGETITITAKVPEGKKFVNWTSNDVTFADANKETTTFVMPEKAVTITANFEDNTAEKEYTVSVSGGTANKTKAKAGETVSVTATVPSGKTFVNWTSSDVTFASASSRTTTFVMPEKNVSVTANFKSSSSGGSGGSSGGGGGGSSSSAASGGSSNNNNNNNNNNTKPSEPTTSTETSKDGTTTTTTTMPSGQVIQTVNVSSDSIKEDSDGNKTVELSSSPVKVTKDKTIASVVEVVLPSDITDEVKVDIPVQNPTPGTVIIIVENNKETIVKTAVADSNGISIKVNGSVKVKIVDNSKTFADVSESAWSSDAIAFVTSRELFSGKTETEFAPSEPMTRAMLVSVLYRLADTPSAEDTSFSDVPSNAYYAQAVAWASKEGIVAGTGNGFNPDGKITREQLATILYRYAGSPTVESNSLQKFGDSSKVSAYANQSMSWAVEKGIITGKDNSTLDPANYATRAEVASMLQRFVSEIN